MHDHCRQHTKTRPSNTRGEVDELGVTTWYPPLRHFQRRRERNEHHDHSETQLGGRISQPEKAGCTTICNDVIDLTRKPVSGRASPGTSETTRWRQHWPSRPPETKRATRLRSRS